MHAKTDENGQPKRNARKRNQWGRLISVSNVRWVEERTRLSEDGQFRILKSDAYLKIPPPIEQSQTVTMGDDNLN